EVWELLEVNGLKDDRQGLKVLITKLENRLNLNHQYTLLDRKDWIRLPAKPFAFPVFNHFSSKLQAAIRHKLTLAELEILAGYLADEGTGHNEFRSLLAQLIGTCEELDAHREVWTQYLSPIQLTHLLYSPDDDRLENISSTLSQDFAQIVAFDRLKKQLRPVDLEL